MSKSIPLMFTQSENKSIKVLWSRKFPINNQQIGERVMAFSNNTFCLTPLRSSSSSSRREPENKFLIDFYCWLWHVCVFRRTWDLIAMHIFAFQRRLKWWNSWILWYDDSEEAKWTYWTLWWWWGRILSGNHLT